MTSCRALGADEVVSVFIAGDEQPALRSRTAAHLGTDRLDGRTLPGRSRLAPIGPPRTQRGVT